MKGACHTTQFSSLRLPGRHCLHAAGQMEDVSNLLNTDT